MMRTMRICGPFSTFVLLLSSIVCGATASAEALDDELKAKLAPRVKDIQAWAADPVLVGAVRDRNQSAPEKLTGLTQEKWKTLSVLDPLVREFTKNDVGRFLKARKGDLVSEAFVSAADGAKVAFLSKPTNWSHAGKPKHDEPMKGAIWYGSIEVDESTGLQQLQVGVPVLENDKPIGSLVVGLDVSRLKEQK